MLILELFKMEQLHSNIIKMESTVLSAFLVKHRSVLAAETLEEEEEADI